MKIKNEAKEKEMRCLRDDLGEREKPERKALIVRILAKIRMVAKGRNSQTN